MFSINQFNASFLPEKTLCLTFDDGPGETIGDGPGPKTLNLAQFLKEENISATFFSVGKFVLQYASTVKEVAKMGHTIGNHTFCHGGRLPDLLQNGWDISSEILMTDSLIKEFISKNTVYFRAPWGAWSEEVALQLNESVQNGINHIGPFFWDIEANDFGFWNSGRSAQECADAYFNKVVEIKKGIVLMHDSTADILRAKNNNLTCETMKLLVPRLKSNGFKFVGLDEIDFSGQ
jgi:peptidoglycan/xylan/chitin deacetylase (PgdA/CDA1 family)